MKKYKIERLEKPEGKITHKLEFESYTQHESSGGFNCGVLFKGTYKECRLKKREYQYGI